MVHRDRLLFPLVSMGAVYLPMPSARIIHEELRQTPRPASFADL